MTEQKQMSNIHLTETGELNIDELDKVSGGTKGEAFAQDVIRGATLGALGITFIGAVTQTVLEAAKNSK